MQTRILICLEDGKFSAASITDSKGEPQPADETAVALAVVDINAAIHAKAQSAEADIAAVQTELTAEREASSKLQSELESALSEIGRLSGVEDQLRETADFAARANAGISSMASLIQSGAEPAVIVEKLAVAIAEGTAPERERKVAQLREERNKLDATIAALESESALQKS